MKFENPCLQYKFDDKTGFNNRISHTSQRISGETSSKDLEEKDEEQHNCHLWQVMWSKLDRTNLLGSMLESSDEDPRATSVAPFLCCIEFYEEEYYQQTTHHILIHMKPIYAYMKY